MPSQATTEGGPPTAAVAADRAPGPAGAQCILAGVKSGLRLAVLLLAALLVPGGVSGEDPVATLFLVRPKPAKDAQDFQVATPDNRELRLSHFKGKVVFLNFWATWCKPCEEEMASMERLHQLYKDKGLVVLAIATDAEGASVVKPFVKRHNLTFAVGLDPRMSVTGTYGVWAVPSTFIVDRAGKRILFANGPREWDSKAGRQLFESLLHEGG